MRFLLNVIWLVFGGFELFLGYIFAGIIACILSSPSPQESQASASQATCCGRLGSELSRCPELVLARR